MPESPPPPIINKVMADSHIKLSYSFWLSLALVLIIIAPLMAIASYLTVQTEGLWTHLYETRLLEYVSNSLILMIGVGGGVLVFGVGCAWLITMYEFKGRRWLEWLLVLPLAMPAYILAYTYTDFLQFTGPLQSTLRQLTGWGWQDYWFPAIRSLGGAVFVLTCALYPYVYVTTRAAFISQSICALEVSRTLGCSPWTMFWRVGLPLARPAIVAGTAFAMMESLADFGAVSYFEVNTFTTGIYRSWYAYGNPTAAAQLASVLLLFVYILLFFERWNEGKRRFNHTSQRYRPLVRAPLTSFRTLLAIIFCSLPVLLGFIIPAILLLQHNWEASSLISWRRLVELSLNTVSLAFITSLFIVTVGMLTVYSVRRNKNLLGQLALRIALLGYATPGVVIAVGLLIILGKTDQILSDIQAFFGWNTAILLSGSLLAVVYGYSARFFAVAYTPLEAGFKKIRLNYEEAAQTLGASSQRIFWQLHIPLLRSSLLSAGLLVFVDIMKELPITMILRPFNFDTLAVEVYQMASTERLDGAAAPALIIVLIGLLPVILLCRAMTTARPGHNVEEVIAT